MTLLDTGQVGGECVVAALLLLLEDPEGQRLLWLPGVGRMVALSQESKRGPAEWEHTARPLTGSQVGLARTHLSLTHKCVGTKA